MDDDDGLDDIVIVSGDSGADSVQDREKLRQARLTIKRHLRRVKSRMEDDKRTKCAHGLPG